MTKHHFVAPVVSLIGIAICALGLSAMSFFQFMPVAFWVEYIDIYPASKVIKTGDDIYYVSELTVHHPVDTNYNDILRCAVGQTEETGRFAFYADQPTTHYTLGKTDGILKATWRYGVTVDEPNTCYMESHIRVSLPFGISKTIKIDGLKRGHTFEVVEDD